MYIKCTLQSQISCKLPEICAEATVTDEPVETDEASVTDEH